MKLLDAPTAATAEEMAQTVTATSAGSNGSSQIQDELDNDNKMSDMSYT